MTHSSNVLGELRCIVESQELKKTGSRDARSRSRCVIGDSQCLIEGTNDGHQEV
jgi:hypothetical protein